MKKEWTLTQESFDKLLAWLHPDREQAGQSYEVIRRTLISYFLNRGCNLPEELADETINRIAQKIDERVNRYMGDPANEFYEMARILYAEHHRVDRSKAA